ncbi:MAG: carboxypeptidase regulatory-like domain-containing protein [Acidobacteriaceae bacterium]|nr:carboxypeptidase regulatory-like domain-containing protein [Acidobacteriaceae bacterium]
MRDLIKLVLPIALVAAIVTASPWLAPAQVQPPVVSPPSAAPTTRSIEGTILSESGAPAPGAVVLLKNGKTLEIRSYVADKDGKYRFYGLSSDIDYELRAQANGMTSKTKTVSVFDSKPLIHLDLKLVKKFKV